MFIAALFVVLPVLVLLGVAVRAYWATRSTDLIADLRRFEHDMPRMESAADHGW